MSSQAKTSQEALNHENGNAEQLNENNIELVMSECKCSREIAIMALESNNGDLVNTIMALTYNQ